MSTQPNPLTPSQQRALEAHLEGTPRIEHIEHGNPYRLQAFDDAAAFEAWAEGAMSAQRVRLAEGTP